MLLVFIYTKVKNAINTTSKDTTDLHEYHKKVTCTHDRNVCPNFMLQLQREIKMFPKQIQFLFLQMNMHNALHYKAC